MQRSPFFKKISDTLTFIKFSHTIFALPFALVSMLVAAHGLPHLRIVFWILVCMVSARTAAMAFNRRVDWNFDMKNPRTEIRSKLATKTIATWLCISALFLFIIATAALNFLCFVLSPLAILLILSYSLTKRFTAYSHFFLGLALSAAPMGAWAAVRGELFSIAPYVLAAGVLCWVFGFDLIYATQDIEFDRAAGLFSFPARFGIEASFVLAQLLHFATGLILIGFGLITHQTLPYWISLLSILIALGYEHYLCKDRDLKKINFAFFQMNALVSMTLLGGVSLSLWMKS